jgi:glycosyltransferase involved in cell wall biosynthesis
MLETPSAKPDQQGNSWRAATNSTPLRPRYKSGASVRVAMIVGDNHTLHCGVKDWAQILAGSLVGRGFEVDVLAPATWNRASVWKFIRKLKEANYDVLHVQYPSIGYRTSLVPHMLGLLRTSRAAVVTLHEFSALPKSQQLSTHVFRWSASRLLFVSEYERSRFNSQLGLLGARQEICPLVSQVPSIPSRTGRDKTIVYFGQIRPKKGLEAYLALAQHSIQMGRHYDFRIMGSVPEAHQAYARSLQERAPLNVRWSFDLSFEDVGSILGRSFAAYLPYPDGASERRGSLLAAWFNGLPVLSRIGPATTPAMRELLVAVDKADEALSALDGLAVRPDESERISRAAREYAHNRTWDDVAKRHAELYQELLLVPDARILVRTVGKSETSDR